MAELQIRDLHVYLGDSYVVQGATLTVDEGQAVAVLGRNGVGKTTLLRSIMGLTDPVRQGSLRWDGVELTLQPAWSRNAAGIAYVPQGRRIFPSLSVEENLLVARRPARPGRTVDDRATLHAVPQSCAIGVISAARALSGGEQQMLALARALIANPRLILLDEPTEGLAPVVVQRILDVLKEIHRKGLGMLLVEQNFRFVTGLTDKIAVMQAGRFAYQGEHLMPDEIRAIAERYLGVSRDILP